MDGSNNMNNSTKRVYHDSSTIEQAVKRYLEQGESVSTLAKYYKVSQPAVYKWIQQYKDSRVERSRVTENRSNVSSEHIAQSNKVDLAITIEALRAENRKLRDKLMDMMIKAGEL